VLRYFTGTHDHKLDDKGRVSLPTEFRRVLGDMNSSEAIYVIPQLHHPNAIVAFTIPAFEKLIERYETADAGNPSEAQDMVGDLTARTSQIQVDDNGRIVLPKAMRALIKLDKNVRFVGRPSSFEIWHPGHYDADEAKRRADGDAPPFIDRRGLH